MELQNEMKIINNTEDHPNHISAKFGSIFSNDFREWTEMWKPNRQKM